MYRKPRTKVNSWEWPSNNGCSGVESEQILHIGNYIDRFGSDRGFFFGVPGEPYIYRSLPWFGNYNVNRDNYKMKQKFYKFYEEADTNINPEHDYHLYKVIKPLNVQSCTIAPAFGFPGGGTQYRSNNTVKDLVQNGYIKEVPWTNSPFFDDSDNIPINGGYISKLTRRKQKTKRRRHNKHATRRKKQLISIKL